MSQLIISVDGLAEFKLWVLKYEMPISQSFVTGQTKMMQQHFPVKTSQPNITFQVQFLNEVDYETFQNFVRSHHLKAMTSEYGAECRLWWPARKIENFTGYIKDFDGGGAKANPAPRAEFTVILVNSMISEKTDISSYGAQFFSVVGQTVDGILDFADDILTPPSLPNTINRTPGQNNNTINGRTYSGGGGTF